MLGIALLYLYNNPIPLHKQSQNVNKPIVTLNYEFVLQVVLFIRQLCYDIIKNEVKYFMK